MILIDCYAARNSTTEIEEEKKPPLRPTLFTKSSVWLRSHNEVHATSGLRAEEQSSSIQARLQMYTYISNKLTQYF